MPVEFLSDEEVAAYPLDVPTVVLDEVAGQLEMTDASCVKRYTDWRPGRMNHLGAALLEGPHAALGTAPLR